MKMIVVKGRIEDDILERIAIRLGMFVDGFREVTATHSSTNVVVEGDLWSALRVLIEEVCEVEAIHVWDNGRMKTLEMFTCEQLGKETIKFDGEVAG